MRLWLGMIAQSRSPRLHPEGRAFGGQPRRHPGVRGRYLVAAGAVALLGAAGAVWLISRSNHTENRGSDRRAGGDRQHLLHLQRTLRALAPAREPNGRPARRHRLPLAARRADGREQTPELYSPRVHIRQRAPCGVVGHLHPRVPDRAARVAVLTGCSSSDDLVRPDRAGPGAAPRRRHGPRVRARPGAHGQPDRRRCRATARRRSSSRSPRCAGTHRPRRRGAVRARPAVAQASPTLQARRSRPVYATSAISLFCSLSRSAWRSSPRSAGQADRADGPSRVRRGTVRVPRRHSAQPARPLWRRRSPARAHAGHADPGCARARRCATRRSTSPTGCPRTGRYVSADGKPLAEGAATAHVTLVEHAGRPDRRAPARSAAAWTSRSLVESDCRRGRALARQRAPAGEAAGADRVPGDDRQRLAVAALLARPGRPDREPERGFAAARAATRTRRTVRWQPFWDVFVSPGGAREARRPASRRRRPSTRRRRSSTPSSTGWGRSSRSPGRRRRSTTSRATCRNVDLRWARRDGAAASASSSCEVERRCALHGRRTRGDLPVVGVGDDASTNESRWNPAVERMFGWTRRG